LRRRFGYLIPQLASLSLLSPVVMRSSHGVRVEGDDPCWMLLCGHCVSSVLLVVDVVIDPTLISNRAPAFGPRYLEVPSEKVGSVFFFTA